ncbi:MAG: hypothetical protein QNL04_14070 [SAR324 cluster bacterium]|nr:hypothetical protein [SAR324 cluster bacterium]
MSVKGKSGEEYIVRKVCKKLANLFLEDHHYTTLDINYIGHHSTECKFFDYLVNGDKAQKFDYFKSSDFWFGLAARLPFLDCVIDVGERSWEAACEKYKK